jgi:hypothetical protein
VARSFNGPASYGITAPDRIRPDGLPQTGGQVGISTVPPGNGQGAPPRDPQEDEQNEKLTVDIEVDGPRSVFLQPIPFPWLRDPFAIFVGSVLVRSH